MNAITWQQTGDRRTWRAASGPVVLTATKLSSGQWTATGDGATIARSPEFRTRTAAQAWAEQHAGGAR